MFTNLPPSPSSSAADRPCGRSRHLPATAQSRRLRRAAGFTLMEVVIALIILGMITGTLFAIIQGSVRASSQIEQVQRENDSINRFLELCRQAFTTLPSTATLTLTALDPNNPVSSAQELTIAGSTRCFSFGIRPISYEDTILGLRPDPAGAVDENGLPLYYLSLSREDLIPETEDNQMALRQETTGLNAPDEQGRYWMPLLPGVVQMKWRFYKAADNTWLEEWDDSAWPDLVELQLQMRDRNLPLRMVYSVPTLQIVAGTGTSSSSSSSSSANSQNQGNNNNNNNQGGGGRPGGGQGGQGGGGRPGGGGQGGQGGGPGGGGGQGGGGGGGRGGGGGGEGGSGGGR